MHTKMTYTIIHQTRRLFTGLEVSPTVFPDISPDISQREIEPEKHHGSIDRNGIKRNNLEKDAFCQLSSPVC